MPKKIAEDLSSSSHPVVHARLLDAISAAAEMNPDDLKLAAGMDYFLSSCTTAYYTNTLRGSSRLVGQTTASYSDTLLGRAARVGNTAAVKRLISLGASVNKVFYNHCAGARENTALMLACSGGHLDAVEALLAAGADPNKVGRKVSRECGKPLPALTHNEAVVLRLLDAKADLAEGMFIPHLAAADMPEALRRVLHVLVDTNPSDSLTIPRNVFETAAIQVCVLGRVECLRILLPYIVAYVRDLDTIRGRMRYHCMRNLLVNEVSILRELDNTAHLTSPLHFVRSMTADFAKALLRQGYRFECESDTRMRIGSPLDLAYEYMDSPASAVIRLAAGPWSPKMHELLPASRRQWVVAVLLLGHLLSRDFGQQAGSFADAWLLFVLPHAGRREFW
jgi:hypothetical protein